MCVVLYSRKERICNACVAELQRDTTSECDETDTGSELGTSPVRDGSPVLDNNSPVSENTLEDTITADDETQSASGSVRHIDTATAGREGKDENMSRSAPSAFDNPTWSMRNSAYSALTWMSGVVSRSFVRPTSENATGVQEGNTEVKTAAESDEVIAAVVSDADSKDTASAVNDTETENSSVIDTSVTQTDVTAEQPLYPLNDSAADTSTRDDTTDNATLCNTSHDLARSPSCQSDSTVHR